jgi:4-hydroxy-3-methylbut-2-enyl diphosphate reductase
MGVRWAAEIALRESSAQTGRDVYTLGPLIHNPAVLEELAKRGVKVLEEDEMSGRALENATVIIRAHGISPAVEKALAGRGARILNATCSHVKASQEKARRYAADGYMGFLAGEEDHAEITGIQGYAEAGTGPSVGPVCHAVGNPAEAEAATARLSRQEPGAKTVLIGQTTISPEEYRAIGEVIRRRFPNLEIVNTICDATAERQNALRELCGSSGAVIIAGGRESANTRRLLSLARDLGKPAWLAEKPGDIPREIRTFEAAGLSAGASTPDSLINEIEEALKAM